MSVLKEKRTVSKAEYVNTANQIYVETVGFLTRLSARYSRLIAEGTAQLAGEVMDHTEKANIPVGRTAQSPAQGAFAGGAGLPLCAGRAPDPCLSGYVPEPARVLYGAQRKDGSTQGGHGQAGPHGAEPGRTDRPGGHPAAEYPGERQEAEISHFYGCIFENAPGGRAAFPSDGGQCVVPFRQFEQQQQFLPCQHRRQRQQ